jgi:hypothetical protein
MIWKDLVMILAPSHVRISKVVIVATADCGSGSNIHSSLDHSSTTFGTVLFHDRRDDHRGLMVVNNGVHQVSTGNSNKGVTSGQRQGFLNSSKFGNWNSELLANSGVGTNGSNDDTSSTYGSSGEADSTTFSKALDKHLPAFTASVLSSQNIAHGDPYILSFYGTVHESSVQGHMTWAHF